MIVLVVGDEVHRFWLGNRTVHDDLGAKQAVEQIHDTRVTFLAPVQACGARVNTGVKTRARTRTNARTHRLWLTDTDTGINR